MIKKLSISGSLAICFTLLLSMAVLAKNCEQTIEANDILQYNLKTIRVAKDCTSLKLTLKHVGKASKIAMGHNWVLSLTKDVDAVVKNGLTAGAKSDYIKKDDKGIIAHTKLIGGGETATTEVDLTKLKKGGDYTFFCLFPGHQISMRGKFIY